MVPATEMAWEVQRTRSMVGADAGPRGVSLFYLAAHVKILTDNSFPSPTPQETTAGCS